MGLIRPGPVSITKVRRSFYGVSYLLDQIGQVTGVAQDLKSCFPNSYKQTLFVAQYNGIMSKKGFTKATS